ncbi:phosphofructokinase beta-subunit [Sarracenia purpurea var. burkii]
MVSPPVIEKNISCNSAWRAGAPCPIEPHDERLTGLASSQPHDDVRLATKWLVLGFWIHTVDHDVEQPGHIALNATLSSRDVDCCLIPENEFYLEGKGGLFEFFGDQLKQNGHAVLVVAEGAGQDIIPRTDAQKEERDESGNLVFLDVGGWLKSKLKKWWKREHPNEGLLTVKYIDPTYMIRAVPENATDNLYCTLLAHSAIHGVMAGYTGLVAGPINGTYAP